MAATIAARMAVKKQYKQCKQLIVERKFKHIKIHELSIKSCHPALSLACVVITIIFIISVFINIQQCWGSIVAGLTTAFITH